MCLRALRTETARSPMRPAVSRPVESESVLPRFQLAADGAFRVLLALERDVEPTRVLPDRPHPLPRDALDALTDPAGAVLISEVGWVVPQAPQRQDAMAVDALLALVDRDVDSSTVEASGAGLPVVDPEADPALVWQQGDRRPTAAPRGALRSHDLRGGHDGLE